MVKDELSYEADAKYVKIGQGITGWTKQGAHVMQKLEKDSTNPITYPTNAYHEKQLDKQLRLKTCAEEQHQNEVKQNKYGRNVFRISSTGAP